MPILKAKSFLHEYKLRAKDEDLNSLSGRQGRKELTYFINQTIFNKLDMKDNQKLLDIGCGDLTLFKIADVKLSKCEFVGVLPTIEEVQRVQKDIDFKGFKNQVNIQKAFSSKLPFLEDTFDKVVINGVLLLLSEEEVNATLKYISKVAKHNATIYIGELPFLNEFEDKSYGNSIFKWLLYGLKNRGFSYFFTSLLSVLKALFSKEQMILGVKEHYYIKKEDFEKKAKKYGLILQSCFKQELIDINKKIYTSQTRQDYIFKVHKEESKNENRKI